MDKEKQLGDVICPNCKTTTDELYEHQTVTNGTKEEWCSDCMRRIDHCLSCDAHIPGMLLYYSIDEWKESVCPECAGNVVSASEVKGNLAEYVLDTLKNQQPKHPVEDKP